MSILRESPHLTDHDDGTVDEYRALSGWAIAALILGVLAPLALVDLSLSVIPLLGIIAAVVALVRIAVSPALTGRKAALVGLFLSVLFASAAGADQWLYWRAIDAEARRFAQAWFAFLANDQPHKAHQLTLMPQVRQPLDDKLWEFYGEGEEWHEELEGYAALPVVRTLLALGDRAKARYYATEASGRDARAAAVQQLFAVTYDDAEQGTTTFFVRLVMQRLPLEHDQAAWRMMNVEDGGEP